MDKRELIEILIAFKQHIVKKYEIKKIYLFGSYSQGKANEDSDVDLIIVGDFKQEGNSHRAPVFYKEWHIVQNIDLPVDILCYTPEEFDLLKNKVTIVKEAIEEGIEI